VMGVGVFKRARQGSVSGRSTLEVCTSETIALGLLTPVMRVMHKPIYDSRKRALVAGIVPHLRPADRVLDVGCGNGSLGQAILASPSCPKGVTVEGLERVKRGGEPIPARSRSPTTPTTW